MVLSQLLPMAEQLLEKIQKEPTAVLKDEAIVLHLALGKYNEFSASLLNKDPKSLDIFIKAVHATKELYAGMPAIQITALEKVSDFFQKLRHSMFKHLKVEGNRNSIKKKQKNFNLFGEDSYRWTRHVLKEYDVFDPFLKTECCTWVIKTNCILTDTIKWETILYFERG